MSAHIPLFYYRARQLSPLKFWRNYKKPKYNFGDELSRLIVAKVAGRTVDYIDYRKPNKLLALGSILHMAQPGDHVWGSGINGNYKSLAVEPGHLNIHAVRGPKTRDFLMQLGHDVPQTYGDPGVLSHLLSDDLSVEPEQDVIIIPHYRDFNTIPAKYEEIVVRSDQKALPVLSKIAAAKLVISSSLHGVICAESLGVPARYVRLTPSEDLFKYEDYYLGWGNRKLKFARSIEEAIEMGGEPLPAVDTKPLLESFPRDVEW